MYAFHTQDDVLLGKRNQRKKVCKNANEYILIFLASAHHFSVPTSNSSITPSTLEIHQLLNDQVAISANMILQNLIIAHSYVENEKKVIGSA